MNRTTKVAVTLIVAASLLTMIYAIPEQRAMAHFRIHLLSPNLTPDAFPFGPNSPDPPASTSKSSDPPGPPFGPKCVGCITTLNVANGAITHPKIAAHSVDQTQLAFAIHNGTNGAIGPVGPQGPPGTLPVQEYVTFNSCGGTNGNHNVQCSIHIEGTSATTLTCTVANPAISGGDNTGDCQTDTSLHLSCVIPPATGPFLCSRLS